ncbi:MAG: NUDIX hydrolase [Verrucomicrobiia bacterium]|jgi:8-oxo-dGTP pyrophosphatase MutT (NUDIX family)
MNRAEFRAQLAALELSGRPAEEPFRQRMITLLDSTAACFLRLSFPAHFTGSALVVSTDGQRALLHHHRKLDRWLQFGGHCDGDEDVLHVAQREAREESGIAGLAAASAQPFDLDIHEIPANGGEPAHFHYDVRYMFIAQKNAAGTVSEESHALRWFTPKEMLALPLDDGLRRLVAKWQGWLAQQAG